MSVQCRHFTQVTECMCVQIFQKVIHMYLSNFTFASYRIKRLFIFTANTKILAISFISHDRQPSYEVNDEVFPNLVDEFPETCDDISNRTFVNIIWELSGNTNIIESTLTIKGSQQCQASKMVWFISGRVPARQVIECDVTEEQGTALQKCKLLCQCACGAECGFLHFRVQNPPWMRERLSLCHYEEYHPIPWYRSCNINIYIGDNCKTTHTWILYFLDI